MAALARKTQLYKQQSLTREGSWVLCKLTECGQEMCRENASHGSETPLMAHMRSSPPPCTWVPGVPSVPRSLEKAPCLKLNRAKTQTLEVTRTQVVPGTLPHVVLPSAACALSQ